MMARPPLRMNATDAVQLRTVDEHAEHREANRRRAVHNTMREYDGRRTMWEILLRCNVNGFALSSDPLLMAARIGEQNLGHWLQADLVSVDESLYDQMVREARARAKEEDQALRAITQAATSTDPQ